MNKMLKGLLVAALTLSAAHIKADSTGSTNKTYLNARSQSVNMAMRWSTFSELMNHKSDDKFGANLEVTGFWQQSVDGKQQAKYFLANNKSTIDMKRLAVAATASANTDLELGYLVHNYNLTGGADAAAVNVGLDPRQESYGVRLDYHQDLRKILKGLYLHADLPVVYVSNDVRLNVNSGVAATDLLVRNFFNGTANAIAKNITAGLTNGLIKGKQSKTGVADIDLGLGYNFVNSAKYNAGLGVALTVPTGNEAKAVYLFEPVVGNGKHFGLGGDLHASAELYRHNENNLRLCAALKYRYLFENGEVRTFGLKGRNLGQYQLLGKNTVNGLVPAANVTTMKVDVTPGSMLEGALSVAYNYGNFNFNLGYDMYFREAEGLKRKDSLAAGTYGVVARNHDTDTAFVITTGTHFDGNATAALSNDSLDVAAATTPSQFTNSINGGAGYVFRSWDCPLMLGAGAKYEWANKNSALSQWGAWLKLGVGF